MHVSVEGGGCVLVCDTERFPNPRNRNLKVTRQISSFHFRDHVMTVFLQTSALMATTI